MNREPDEIKRKPSVGEEFYVVTCLRGDGRNRTAKVSKVGTKYFQLDGLPRAKFRIDDWGQDTEYNVRYKLWPSKAEYDRERQAKQLWALIKDRTSYGSPPSHLSIEGMWTILSLLSPSEAPPGDKP